MPVPRVGISDVHWTWDPSVHTYYNESCHFFLIRFNAQRLSTADRVLTDALTESQLDAFSVYLLLGYHDALIRVWVTPQKRRRLVDRLRSRPDAIESVEEFRADRIEYTWASSPPDPSTIRSHRGKIEQAVAVLNSSGLPEDSGLAKELSKVGILHRVPVSDSSSAIKLYISLNRDRGEGERSPDAHHLLSTLNASHATAVSLYEGVGFAQLLVKAVLPSFGDVIPLLTKLETTLPAFRPLTFLIGENAPLQLDNIDIDWKEFSRELLDLEEQLGPLSASYIAALTEAKRLEVGEFYAQFQGLLDSPARRYFLGYLGARLSQSPDELSQQLIFIVHLESLLRRRLIEIGARHGGAAWLSIVRRSGSTDDIERSLPDPGKWTYADFGRVLKAMHALGWVAEDDPILGRRWRDMLPRLTTLRNTVAHGDLFEEERARAHWNQDWSSTAGLIGEALALFAELVARDGDKGP